MRRRDEKCSDNGFEAWGGYMHAKIAKLEEQFLNKAGNDEHKVSDLFNGISIYVNGFTKPSADELKELMSQHGGVYHTYQRSNDFIIASNLPDTKVKNMSLVRVVKPEWITESIAANRLLDYRQYLLYKTSRTQPQLNFNKNIKKEHNSIDTTKSVSSLDNVTSKEIKASSNSDTMLAISIIHHVKSDSLPKTAVDPNFISEFYNNSRLHHISQLGAFFKQHVNDMRVKNDFSFPARKDLKSSVQALDNSVPCPATNFDTGKVIMHIDMDCFFVSVGLRKRPELFGKPVAVTHSKGTQPQTKRPGVDRVTEFNLYKQKQANKLGKTAGILVDDVEFENRIDNIGDEGDKYGSMSEIASCSYEARAKGIKNGMFMGAALRLCPDLQTIPYDFEEYKEVAFTLYNTIAQYTLDIEAVSCDEMYVDCTELIKVLDVNVQDFATAIRKEIKSKTGCPCSTGFGGNRLQARLATRKAKPDGQFFLTSDLVEDFMFNIILRDLPGVGRQTAQKLESLGHQTCGSLQTLTLGLLQRHLGNKTGAQLFDQCRGKDSNPLMFHNIRKSVSAEVNYGIRFENNDQCFQFLKQLSAEVNSRMQQFKVLGKCITLKLMVRAEEAPVETAKFMGHGFCNVINKSTSLTIPTNDVEIISKEVIALCKKQNIDPKEMRGIGIQISKLEPTIVSKPNNGGIAKFLNKNKNVSSNSYSNIAVDRKSLIFEKTSNKLEDDSRLKKSIASHINNHTVLSPMKKASLLGLSKSSPKKENILSPVKKIPKLGLSKLSPCKKRGRPPKILKNPLSTSKNVMVKFLNGQIQANEEIQCQKEEKQEVFEKSQNTPVQIQEGLLGLPWEKVRKLLVAWLDSGQSPKFCDTSMIAAYLSKLAYDKHIDKVYILLNFLRRKTKELNNKVWTDVYDYVSEEVQNSMITVYGKKLWVND